MIHLRKNNLSQCPRCKKWVLFLYSHVFTDWVAVCEHCFFELGKKESCTDMDYLKRLNCWAQGCRYWKEKPLPPCEVGRPCTCFPVDKKKARIFLRAFLTLYPTGK